MNGKRNPWEGVNLLPFIDQVLQCRLKFSRNFHISLAFQHRLFAAIKSCGALKSPSLRERNRRGLTKQYRFDRAVLGTVMPLQTTRTQSCARPLLASSPISLLTTSPHPAGTRTEDEAKAKYSGVRSDIQMLELLFSGTHWLCLRRGVIHEPSLPLLPCDT